MSFATNGIVNASGGDPSTGGNSFSDPDAQYGGVAVGSADSFLGVSANSSVVGNANTMSSSVNAGVLGRGNTLYDSNYSWIVGGDGKTYNSTPNTTFIPNHYVVADSGNVKTSTGSAAAAPRYLQLPGVVAAPSGANDEFTFAIPAGAASFDSAGEYPYVKKTAGWSKMALFSDLATAQTLAQTLATGNSTLVNDIIISASQQLKYVDGVRIGANNVDCGGIGVSAIGIGEAANANADNSVAVGRNTNIAGAATSGVAVGDGTLLTAPAINGTAIGPSASAAELRAAAFGYSATANHIDSVAIGSLTQTDATKQIKLGADSTYYAETPGYYKSGLQKACAVGRAVALGDAAQTVASGATATLAQVRTFFDWSTTMISGDNILLDDLNQVWGVSVNVNGSFTGGPSTNTWTITTYWYDGAVERVVSANDYFATAAATVFNGCIGSGIKSNGSAGQYIRAEITNNTGATMNINRFRFSAIRIA